MSAAKSIRGFSIVEIVVAAAIIAVVGLAATGTWQGYIKVTKSSADYTQTALLTEEASEALELFRDQSWSGYIVPLSLNTTYYLYWNGSRYATSTSPVAVNNAYAVSFSLSSIMRDSSSNIVTSGGTNDPNTLKAAILVAPLGDLSSPYSRSDLLIHNVYAN